MHCGVHKHAQKTGWLSKRGGRIQTWHKRWFVLTGDMLFYYKSNQDSRPTGTVPLAGNNVVRHQDDPRQPNSYKFEIIAGSGRNFVSSTHDSYLISADSAADANSWVAAIKRALHEPYGGGMFGRSLQETMQVEARLGGSYVPILVHRCAKFVMDHGLEEVGIFRLPGQTSRVQALKEMYDQGSQKEFLITEDVHTIASLLKLYLRELPDPIIPCSLIEDVTSAVKAYEVSQEDGVMETLVILKQLTQHSFNVLKYICRFLYLLSLKSDKNKMNSGNLGTIFGPNLISPKSSNPQCLIESSNISASFVTHLIRTQDKLFPITSDEVPPKRLSIVSPMDLNGWQDTYNKAANKIGGSLFIKGGKNDTTRSETRSRLGSVPTRLLSPLPSDGLDKSIKIKPHKLLQRLDSPRRTRKNIFSSYDPNPSLFLDCSSGRVSPIITNSPTFHHHDRDPPSPISADHDERLVSNSVSDSSSPEMSDRFSSGLGRDSDTFPPDLVVNSIAREMEGLEKQLKVMKDALVKKKKEARLWCRRYEQERIARLAAEDQIQRLQTLVDQTFQQFALDDSEDDFDDDDIAVYGSEEESFEETPLIITENGVNENHSPIIPVNYPLHERDGFIRHVRAQSSQ